MKLGPIALLWFAFLPSVSNAAPAPIVWHTYKSADYGFSLRYPSTFKFLSPFPVLDKSYDGMISICPDITVACFEYVVGDNQGTDFQAAGLTVNILRDRKTEQACYQPERNSDPPLKPRTINGIRFHTGEYVVVAAGSSGGGDIYRVFHQGICFEIALNDSVTDAWIPQDTGPRFKASKEDRISRDLDTMLRSFTFTGPVEDGPAWDVYRDSCCGVSFEYPQGDKVELTIDYDSHATQPQLESQHFLHGDRDYTVAVVSGNNEDVGDTWLQSENYPALSSAKLLKKSKSCKEYHAEPYYYFACVNDLYVLGSSDTSHHAVSPQGDRVFLHLLNTFKCQ